MLKLKYFGIILFGLFILNSSFALSETVKESQVGDSLSAELQEELDEYYQKLKDLNKQKKELFKELSDKAKQTIKDQIARRTQTRKHYKNKN
ncbi:hypothetical protein [Rickettsiales endosymbiont of Stachyamoeba lipophora]|uniref:hypothetical protein n=1 Tax=Rickettsiales endosymbiont of Stachyamoeba lipophora TaxID=2486578 RepID=UPI000F64898F|nr:hypothetical protein [Rickettsiales endosymbiont of Stachyamoeba lipophora]AZL15290.1 hypothetical protein EF513_01800 [Rickettsiales endosymbiont of Stachyamoeba lipophora]